MEKVIDQHNTVLCDTCGTDFTNSSRRGGLLVSFATENGQGKASAMCPFCTIKYLPEIHKRGWKKYIGAVCPLNMTFKDFVLKIRTGQMKATTLKGTDFYNMKREFDMKQKRGKYSR